MEEKYVLDDSKEFVVTTVNKPEETFSAYEVSSFI